MNHSDSGLAHGTSGSPQTSLENMEMELRAAMNAAQYTHLISNKFPSETQRGKRYDFKLENGRILLKNGIRYANFVIDRDGKLHIGNGHAFLANGNDVIAAGSLKINKHGYVRQIINNSGHYQPTPVEAMEYPSALKSLGLNIDNAWISIYRYDSTKSGLVRKQTLVYSGKVKHFERRFQF